MPAPGFAHGTPGHSWLWGCPLIGMGGTKAPCWGTPVHGPGGGVPGGGDREQVVTRQGGAGRALSPLCQQLQKQGWGLVLPFLGGATSPGQGNPKPCAGGHGTVGTAPGWGHAGTAWPAHDLHRSASLPCQAPLQGARGGPVLLG